MIDKLLSGGAILNNKQVSIMLGLVEGSLGLIAPFMSQDRTQVSRDHTGTVQRYPSAATCSRPFPRFMFCVYYERPKLRFSHNKKSSSGKT